jgi:hypothetical protein
MTSVVIRFYDGRRKLQAEKRVVDHSVGFENPAAQLDGGGALLYGGGNMAILRSSPRAEVALRGV